VVILHSIFFLFIYSVLRIYIHRQVLQIFLTIKMPCSGRHATAYTVPAAVITFNVIQGEWFSCHLKANMRLPISD